MNDYDRECAIPILFVVGLSLLIGLLAYWQCQYEDWVHTNCQVTEEVRTVEDYPIYVDVSGEGSMIVPVGGGSHQERAWACPAIDGRAARTVWMGN